MAVGSEFEGSAEAMMGCYDVVVDFENLSIGVGGERAGLIR